MRQGLVTGVVVRVGFLEQVGPDIEHVLLGRSHRQKGRFVIAAHRDVVILDHIFPRVLLVYFYQVDAVWVDALALEHFLQELSVTPHSIHSAC